MQSAVTFSYLVNMDKRMLYGSRVTGYVYCILLASASVLSEPIATDSENHLVDRLLETSHRRNAISSLRHYSHDERTNSRLDQLEERLSALEAEYRAIKEKNRALERRLLEQEKLDSEQGTLVATLKRIVGPISPSGGPGQSLDPIPHETPFGEGQTPPPPSTTDDPSLGDDRRSDRWEGSTDTSVGGNQADTGDGPASSGNSEREDLLEVNEYLGNMEAELVQLNPNGNELVAAAADDFERVSSNPLLYGKALLYLDEQTSLLRANYEDVLEKVEEFKAQVIELLAGTNQTSNVLQVTGVKENQPNEDRGGFLDEILRDLGPSRDTDLDGSSDRASGKCGFSVASSFPQMGIQGTPQIVKFDFVFVNKGNNFKTDNSTFVCEIPGYYYFTFSARSYDHRYLGVTLMKNDEYQVAVYTDSDERSVMESQSVMIHLTTGDAVWLRLSPSSKFGLYSDQYHLTTFSGILIYKGN